MINNICKGNIYFINLPKQNIIGKHSCEIGHKPCVIVSNNVGNRTSKVVLVCPMTHKLKDISCNVNVTWKKGEKDYQVLCNHITAIPIEILGKCKGILTDNEINEVDIAMMKALGIKYEC